LNTRLKAKPERINVMKYRQIVCFAFASALALPLVVLAGCDHEVSSSTSTTTKRDGTVKSEEKTVTKSPDGSVTTEEIKKTTTPANP
jgi:hypothetical protein